VLLHGSTLLHETGVLCGLTAPAECAWEQQPSRLLLHMCDGGNSSGLQACTCGQSLPMCGMESGLHPRMWVCSCVGFRGPGGRGNSRKKGYEACQQYLLLLAAQLGAMSPGVEH
jgi:hypothetical protein